MHLLPKWNNKGYVTSLSFWDNFCAWIESIFTNYDRGEILLDKFLNAISDDTKEAFYSELLKQLPGNEKLQKIAEIIIQKDPRGLSEAIEARCNELHNNIKNNISSQEELNQLIDFHYKIVDRIFSGFKKAADDIKIGNVPNKKDLQPIITAYGKGYIAEAQFNELNNKLISNIEYTVLTTNEQDKFNSILEDFKGTNSCDSLDYFLTGLEGFLRESKLSVDDLSLPIISKNNFKTFTTYYREALNECPKSEGRYVEWKDFLNTLQEKILKDQNSDLYKSFSNQQNAGAAGCLGLMLMTTYAIGYEQPENIQISEAMIPFDELMNIGANVWDAAHKNDNIEQPINES